MSKTILAQVDGFTPLIDAVVLDVGVMSAAVFGKAWRYCQMSDGVCKAGQERIADELGISRITVNTHFAKLVEAGYLKDTTPNLLGLPHIYVDTGKAGVSIILTGRGVKNIDSGCKEYLQGGVKNIDSKKVVKKEKKIDVLGFMQMAEDIKNKNDVDKVEELLCEIERGLHVNIARSTNNQAVAKRILKDGRPFGQWLTWCISEEWRAAHLYIYADLDKVWRDYPQGFVEKQKEDGKGINEQGEETLWGVAVSRLVF